MQVHPSDYEQRQTHISNSQSQQDFYSHRGTFLSEAPISVKDMQEDGIRSSLDLLQIDGLGLD